MCENNKPVSKLVYERAATEGGATTVTSADTVSAVLAAGSWTVDMSELPAPFTNVDRKRRTGGTDVSAVGTENSRGTVGSKEFKWSELKPIENSLNYGSQGEIVGNF